MRVDTKFNLPEFVVSVWVDMTSFHIDPSSTGYGKTGVRLLKIRRSGKYHGIKQIEVSTELKLNNYEDYLRGDNASIVPTDTQKNTVYALAKQHQASKFVLFYCATLLSFSRAKHNYLLERIHLILKIVDYNNDLRNTRHFLWMIFGGGGLTVLRY